MTDINGMTDMHDVSETVEANGMLPDLQRLNLLENVMGAANLGLIVLDGAHRIVLWNRWMERHSGRPAGAALGADFFALFPDLMQNRVGSAVGQALRDNFPSLLSQTLNKSPFPLYVNAANASNAAVLGERMLQAVAITPIGVAGASRHCLIQINDVSHAVGREKLLRDQTQILRTETFLDGLTGVANRRHFDVAIEKEVRRAKRSASALSLLMIDIDSFKPYNDHYGHQQGDVTLIKVALALAAILQRPGDLLARYGGEEFVAILPDTDAAQALQMAETICAKISELDIPHAHAHAHAHTHADETAHVTVSIGIATTNIANALDSGALIGAADRALYQAKHAGRNCVIAHSPGQTGTTIG